MSNFNVTAMSTCASALPVATPSWLSNGGFIPVLLGIVVMFWGIAYICEEYGVPSITVFCKRNKIPDDIAGAVFIGTGLSLPVLFVSFVGLFVSNSAIGVGTVVGGNIFNHLVTIGSSIYASPNRTMKLDAVIFTREMFCYFISCLILICTVQDGNISKSLSTSFSHTQWLNCLSISWIWSLVLIMGYIGYLILDMNYFDIQNYLCKFFQKPGSSCGTPNTCSTVTTSSRTNHAENEGLDTDVAIDMLEDDHNFENVVTAQNDIEMNAYKSELKHYSSGGKFIDYSLDMEYCYDTDLSAIEGTLIAAVDSDDEMDFSHFVLYLRSDFYSRNQIGCVPSARKWKLRYFTLDEFGLRYRVESHLPIYGPHIRFINIFDLDTIQVLNSVEFEFSIGLHNREEYVFRAENYTTFMAVKNKLMSFRQDWFNKPDDERVAMGQKALYEVSNGRDNALVSPNSESVSDNSFVIPYDSYIKMSIFFLVFPMKYAIYLTVPDVRKTGCENKAILSFVAGLFWLALQSYILTVGLTLIGNWWNINGAIMGLTVAAWAANYPAHWSSIVVAKDGYGDIASCNVYGSNVFNNFIGLGVPWLTYSLVNGGDSYDALQDQGVVLSIILLMVIVVVHYVIVAYNKWILTAWMSPVMLIVYFVYIGYLCYMISEL